MEGDDAEEGVTAYRAACLDPHHCYAVGIHPSDLARWTETGSCTVIGLGRESGRANGERRLLTVLLTAVDEIGLAHQLQSCSSVSLFESIFEAANWMERSPSELPCLLRGVSPKRWQPGNCCCSVAASMQSLLHVPRLTRLITLGMHDRSDLFQGWQKRLGRRWRFPTLGHAALTTASPFSPVPYCTLIIFD
jgi:hypothetical protein